MPFVEDVIQRKEYLLVWKNASKCEVHLFIGSEPTRKNIGVVFVGPEQDCRTYIGEKVGGLSLVAGQVVCSKLATKYERAMDSLLEKVVA